MNKKCHNIVVTVLTLACIMLSTVFICAETDKTAPVCTGFTLEDSSVVKPGYIRINISFEENGTGIEWVEISATKKKGENHFYYNIINFDREKWEQVSEFGATWKTLTPRTLPKRKLFNDTVSVDLYVGDYCDADEYYINEIAMKDAAGNYSTCGNAENVSDMDLSESVKFIQKEYSYPYEEKEPSFYTKPWIIVKDEFDYQFEESLSNPNIRNDVKYLEEGRTAKLLIDETTIVPKEAFDAIAGKDCRIVAYNDAYQWIFYGKDILNETKDIDVKTTYSKISENEYNTEEDSCAIIFRNNGVLPGKCEIRIASDYAYELYEKDEEAFLYYINGTNPELQDNSNIGTKLQGDKKWCKFEINHNSKYVLTGSEVNSNCSVAGHKYVKKSMGNGLYKNTCSKCGHVEYIMNNSYVKSFKISKGKRCFTAKWNQQSKKNQKKFSGYQIRYSKYSNMSGSKTATAKKSAKSKKIKKLTKKTKYYVQVRSYYKKGGHTYYSKWSSKKSVKTK